MKILNIYIDGSHLDKKNNGRLGIGGVLIDPSKRGQSAILNKFSKELLPEYMKREFNADKASNPSAELIALLISLREFKNKLNSVDIVNIYADYIGVKEWMEGNWKVKESYIIEIKRQIDKEIEDLKLSNKLKFHWIKAHQKNGTDLNVYWNNYVDLLAKGKE